MTPAFSRTDLLAVLAGAVPMTAALLLPTGAGPAGVVAAVTVSAMIVWIAWQDIVSFTIPDGPLVAIALTGAALRLADPAGAGESAMAGLGIAIDAAVCGGALWALREGFFRYRGMDGLGLGDVKLAAVAGVLIGMEAFAWALLVASLTALAAVAIASIISPSRVIERLPFGAFLAPACWFLWMLQGAGAS